MTEVSDGILSKIRGALAVAEHPDTPQHEADNAMAFAMRLMAQYGVERTMLLASNPAANVVGDLVLTVPAPYAQRKMDLLNAVSVALGVKAVQMDRRGDMQMHLFGLSSDLERVDMLFTSLLIQAARFMDRDRRTLGGLIRRPKTWTGDWMHGFTARIYERLLEAEARARREQPGGVSTDLVFARRDELVLDAAAKRYPGLVQTKGRRRSGAGVGLGLAAGDLADLGGTRVGRGEAAALGR